MEDKDNEIEESLKREKEVKDYEQNIVKQAGLRSVFGNKWMKIVTIGMSGLLATIWYVWLTVR